MYDQVRTLLNSERFVGGDPVSLAAQASALQHRLLLARNDEFAYVQEGLPSALERWRASVEEMSNALELLKGRVEENTEESLTTALAALVEYRKAFQRYRDSRILSRQTAKQMDEQARTVLTQVEQATADRQVQMAERGRSVIFLQAIGAIVIVVLALIATLVIRHLIVKPLRENLQIARRVSKGDLSGVAEVGGTRRDEVGQLMAAVGEMTVNLRQLVARIEQSVAGIGQTSATLETLSAQSNSAAQRQKLETEHAATATQQMSVSVQQVAENAEQQSIVAEKISRNVTQVLCEAEHCAEANQKVVLASDDLAGLEQELREAVAQFSS